jgi:predicted O-methyltransferase YrrM
MSRPEFGDIEGVAVDAVRQIYMMGAVWRLAKDRAGSSLNILEVGSWVGISTLTFGQGLAQHNEGRGHITSVDAWLPYVDLTENQSPKYVEINDSLRSGRIFDAFHRNMKNLPPSVGHSVIRGWSADVLPQLRVGSYDLVFLDGDHSYANVRADLDNAMPLVTEGGIICGDDLELQADDVNAEIARGKPSLDYVYAMNLDCAYHPGVSLAVYESFGRVSEWAGFWAMQKKNGAWLPVSLSDMPLSLPPYASAKTLLQIKERLGLLG